MKPELNAIAEIDRVIHEPGRLMIVALLFTVEKADFVYLQYETGLNKGNLSSHIAKLEAAGYLAMEKTFRGKVPQTLLSLTGAGREAFTAYRRTLKEFCANTSPESGIHERSVGRVTFREKSGLNQALSFPAKS
jgi:DNA-binding MarR family transcriptional regulator